ncbi:conjugal transfer protein [Streptosporangium vulgare]|uniref:conjugal transfer protein n=1 Tax=Streptosporangium vulgare TaxID=46190 RepID=UPI0031D0A822
MNFDGARLAERESRLAPYLPECVEAQFGWDVSQDGALERCNRTASRSSTPSNAVVTVAYQSENRRQLLSCRLPRPASRRGRRRRRPGILPAPRAADLPPKPAPERDPRRGAGAAHHAGGLLQGVRGRHHRACSSTPTPGSPAGFGGAFTFLQLKDLAVPSPGGSTREVTATVTWGVPSKAPRPPSRSPPTTGQTGGKLEQSYLLTMVKQGDKWFVKDIRGAYRSVAG